MPRVVARQVPVYFKPPHVSLPEIDKVIVYYNNQVSIPDIIRRVQHAKVEREGKCLSYPDVYTILFHARKDARVQQRLVPAGELPIADFQFYFQAFRDGGTADECWAAITAAGQKVTTKTFHTKLFRAMGDRHREHSRRFVDQVIKLDAEARERQFSTDLLKYFKRTKVGPAGQARPAIILYLDDLPADYLLQIKELNTDFSREMLLALNPGMLSELEQQEVKKQRLAAPKKITPEMQEALINDAVEVLGLGVQQEPRPQTKSKLPPEPLPPTEDQILDEQELAVLTPEQLAEEEVEQPKRVPLPSAHGAGSESPTESYDLSNLSDDDALDPDEQSPNHP